MSEALQAEIERLTNKVAQLYEGAEEQRKRIKRLEEAGDRMYWTLDAEETGSVGKEAWRKAKEAKP